MRGLRGFTLLELLVVIIIVGVLAAVAMPQLFNQIELARSSEARNTIGAIKRAMEGCYMGTQNYGACLSWDSLGMSDPGTAAGAHFTYVNYFVGGANCKYTIVATRNALDNGNTGNHVTFGLNNAGYFWCSEYGIEQNCDASCLPY